MAPSLGAVPAAGKTCSDATSGVGFSSGSTAGGNANGAGSFTYTAVCTDVAGNRTSVSAAYTVLDAQALKARTIATLTPYAGQNKKIAKAISLAQDSLQSKYWLDGSHINPKTGHKVFQSEKHAVQEFLGPSTSTRTMRAETAAILTTTTRTTSTSGTARP